MGFDLGGLCDVFINEAQKMKPIFSIAKVYLCIVIAPIAVISVLAKKLGEKDGKGRE